VTNLIIRSLHDDSSTVFLNGVRIYNNNITQDPRGHASLATGLINHDGRQYLQGTYPNLNPNRLTVGRNRLAVVVHPNGNTEDTFGNHCAACLVTMGT